jgi:hypothetical protein
MVDLRTASATTADAIEEPKVRTPSAAPPDAAASTEVLITEQEVLLSTAAALPVRRKSLGRRFAASIGRIFAAPTPVSQPKRRDYPRRYEFLERSLMGREMDRL